MPEYTYNGLSTYYATTCRECAAGCGLIVRTMQGRASKWRATPINPVNRGKDLCPRSDYLQGLYNPRPRLGPIKHKRGEALYSQNFQAIQPNIEWDEAFDVIANALKDPTSVAFPDGDGARSPLRSGHGPGEWHWRPGSDPF